MYYQRFEEKGYTNSFGLPVMVLYDKLLGVKIFVTREEFDKTRMFYHSQYIREEDVKPEK